MEAIQNADSEAFNKFRRDAGNFMSLIIAMEHGEANADQKMASRDGRTPLIIGPKENYITEISALLSQLESDDNIQNFEMLEPDTRLVLENAMTKARIYLAAFKSDPVGDKLDNRVVSEGERTKPSARDIEAARLLQLGIDDEDDD